eukprot:TRINITY_DN7520_c0_g1_i1.p1 TRINITY_DN7520_c0_g1~~TRINITY_DN7520_c0_g1_i1.p1  ORF type:complete len:975 (+),score=143.42 TRINITY_DN7520_c0_g1_i1:1013-3937(+)
MPAAPWDIVAVCGGDEVKFGVKKLEERVKGCKDWMRELGVSSETTIVAVPDPFGEDANRKSGIVGSGGAALNAVLHVAEMLSSRMSSGNIIPSVFHQSRVAVLLCGASESITGSLLGKAFSPLPLGPPETMTTGGITNAELLLLSLSRMVDSAPAVWVCSTDWLIHTPGGFASPFSADRLGDVTALAFIGPESVAHNHGIYKIASDNTITDILYKPGNNTPHDVAFNGQVLVVAPIVRFSPKSAECFLSLYVKVPFDACTYYGSDSSSVPGRLNLFLDVLMSLTTKGKIDYVSKSDSTTQDKRWSCLPLQARQTLVRTFSGLTLKAAIPSFPPMFWAYPQTAKQWCISVLSLINAVRTDSRIYEEGSQQPNKLVFRSDISPTAIIGNHTILHSCEVGHGAVIQDGCYLYHQTIIAGEKVESGTFRGYADVLDKNTSYHNELKWVEELNCQIDLNQIRTVLTNGENINVTPALERLSRCTVVKIEKVLSTLDEILLDVPLAKVGRVLHITADYLAACAYGKGGLRSGPARNSKWLPAIKAMQRWDKSHEGKSVWVKELAKERKNWLETPELLIRAARHYEGAAAVITAICVDSASTFIEYTEAEKPVMNEWITCTSPARIDLSGGWTDTPPVSYETGGRVVNIAIAVGGEQPLKASARLIPELILKLRTDTGISITCSTLESLADFNTPQAPAAILKAAFIALNIVCLTSDQSLEDQLRRFGGGIEVKTSSTLPVGSGLGGSSILGGVLLKAIGLACSRDYDLNSLVHAVLRLEQLLTSGGGWQDQVGGFYPNMKCCSSAASLPLKVETTQIHVRPGFLRTLSSHMLLVYTGRARLARNLLQGVLRRWAARLPEVVSTVEDLRANGEKLIKAIEDEDIPLIGESIKTYWEQKKLVAGCGVEPLVVATALREWDEHIHGSTLGGAGGGGFMLLVTKKPNIAETLKKITFEGSADMSFYDMQIDEIGLNVTRGGNEV